MRLDNDHDRWPRTGGGIVAKLTNTAGDDEANILFTLQRGMTHCRRNCRGKFGVVLRDHQLEQRRRGSKSSQMPVEEERRLVVGPKRFIDPFAIQKSVIEDRNDGEPAITDCSIYVNR